MTKYMELALKEAEKAYKNGEVPVGAVIVKNNKIVAKSRNNRQKKKNILGHAEINCIIKAEKKLKDWRLDGCTLYVTLEPCDMCSIVIKESRIEKVVFLLNKDKKLYNDNEYDEISLKYKKLLQNFFVKLR